MRREDVVEMLHKVNVGNRQEISLERLRYGCTYQIRTARCRLCLSVRHVQRRAIRRKTSDRVVATDRLSTSVR